MATISAKSYAQAVYASAQKPGANPKHIVAQLVKYLEIKGRAKVLPQILQELKRLDAREAKLAPVVEVAHENDSETALKEAGKLGIHASKAHVNHALIKGWRAAGNGKLYDASAKRELIEIYRNIIN